MDWILVIATGIFFRKFGYCIKNDDELSSQEEEEKEKETKISKKGKNQSKQPTDGLKSPTETFSVGTNKSRIRKKSDKTNMRQTLSKIYKYKEDDFDNQNDDGKCSDRPSLASSYHTGITSNISTNRPSAKYLH